jgi:hypothetical protein
MSDSLISDGYTQPHSYGDIPVLPTFLSASHMLSLLDCEI